MHLVDVHVSVTTLKNKTKQKTVKSQKALLDDECYN